MRIEGLGSNRVRQHLDGGRECEDTCGHIHLVQCLGLRVPGLGFRVWGLGFGLRVEG